MGRLLQIMREMFQEEDPDTEVEATVTGEEKDTAPLLSPMEANRQGLARVCLVVLQPFLSSTPAFLLLVLGVGLLALEGKRTGLGHLALRVIDLGHLGLRGKGLDHLDLRVTGLGNLGLKETGLGPLDHRVTGLGHLVLWTDPPSPTPH